MTVVSVCSQVMEETKTRSPLAEGSAGVGEVTSEMGRQVKSL